MTWEIVLSIFLDALKDSGFIFLFVFIVHFLLTLFDTQFANFIIKRRKSAPIFGSLFGLIPQCGTSVLGAELYIKKYITIGTLIAIFLSCSDEAFIAILASGVWDKALLILPLIAIKLGVGILSGIIIDLIFKKQDVLSIEKYEEEKVCHTHHHENTKFHEHFIHPLIHSLKVFVYVFVINMALGVIIAWVGEDNFTNFLLSNRYLTPLYSGVIGLIPNCASSLLLSELFTKGSLSFGALTSGLLVNSGLGLMVLLKHRKSAKNVLFIILITFVIAITSGYIICLISGF